MSAEAATRFTATLPPSRRRRYLIWIGLALALGVLAYLLTRLTLSDRLPLYDFIEYWAAGRLNLSGGNPYDGGQLLALQRTVGWTLPSPVRMWNPPWTLAIITPFALLEYPVARMLWLIFETALVVVSAQILWQIYGGPPRQRWFAWLLALTFVPTLDALKIGQLAPVLLLGLAAFLRLGQSSRRGHWYLAGAAVAVVAVKPQLLYLFFVAIAVWAVDRRRWPALVGTALALAGGAAVALSSNRFVLAQFVQATLSEPPSDWLTPTLGTALRLVFGWDHFELQFLAPLLGCGWFVFYWRKHRRNWRWPEQLPLLLLVSLVTTPYGWSYDQTVVLVAIIQIAGGVASGRRPLPWLILIGYAGLELLLVALGARGTSDEWYIWLAPILLLLYLMANRRLPSRQRAAAEA